MLSNRIVRKSMNAFITSAVLWAIFFAATTGPVLAGLLIALNMSNVEIGFINSLALLTLPCQLLGAWLQQRFWGRKSFWFVTGVVYYVSYILLVLLLYFWGVLDKHIEVYLFIFIFGIGLIFVNLGVPVWFAWVGDLVPPRASNRFWNRRSGLSQLSLVVCSIIVGIIIDYLGKQNTSTYVLVIGGGTIFGIISMFISMIAKDSTPYRKIKQVSILSKLRLIWRNINFRQLVWFFGLQSFAQWLIIPFTFIYLQRTLDLSMSVIQLLVALSGITSFLSTYVFQVIGSKYGRKPIILLCTFIKGIEFIFWALLLPGSPWFIIVIPFILGGIVNIGLLTSTFSLLTSAGKQQLKTLSIALFFAVTGLLGFIASVSSGIIYDKLETLKFIETSLFTPYNVISAFGSILFFVSMLLFIKFKEEGAIPTVKVVKTLFANNPFRAIYHTHVLSNPMQEKSRIQALNKAKGNLMVSELISDLYSPSNRIRESAVWNIGRKGPKADTLLADELMKVLDMPALGIQAQAARALGHIQYHDATQHLVKHIDSGDTTLSQSCIFALGLIGDKEAIHELENILRHDRFAMLWSHAAEALGRIGDFHNIRDIHKAYTVEFNWVLKKQFLIAMLRTIAYNKSRIYQLFEQEEKSASTVTEKIINSIQAVISKKDKSEHMKDMFTQAFVYEDHNNYIASLEQILIIIFNQQEEIFSEKNWTHENISKRLNFLFASNQKIRSKELLENTFRATLFWLLIKIWVEIKYSSSSFDQYLYLTALQVAEFIVKADTQKNS